MSALSLVEAQEQFTTTLKSVEDAVRFTFRKRLRPQEYEEALAEAKAACSAWHGLIRRGKDPVAVGVHGIPNNACRYVKKRRRIGNKSSGRGAMDVYHRKAQEACSYKLVSLDTGDVVDSEESTRGSWREWLAEDNRIGPADEAAFRVDFAAWLEGLPARNRRIAELLTEDHGGGRRGAAGGALAGASQPGADRTGGVSGRGGSRASPARRSHRLTRGHLEPANLGSGDHR